MFLDQEYLASSPRCRSSLWSYGIQPIGLPMGQEIRHCGSSGHSYHSPLLPNSQAPCGQVGVGPCPFLPHSWIRAEMSPAPRVHLLQVPDWNRLLPQRVQAQTHPDPPKCRVPHLDSQSWAEDGSVTPWEIKAVTSFEDACFQNAKFTKNCKSLASRDNCQ